MQPGQQKAYVDNVRFMIRLSGVFHMVILLLFC